MLLTDTEMIDFLEKLNAEATYTGQCVLQMSDTGRGWRLHETSEDGFSTVREAIQNFGWKNENRKEEE